MQISILFHIIAVVSLFVPISNNQNSNHTCKRADTEDVTAILTNLIETFHESLRSFANETKFDVKGFTIFRNILKAGLAKVGDFIREVTEKDNELVRVLAATENLYKQMQHCADHWHDYRNNGDPGRKVLFDINELMVIFNVLSDSKGVPQPDLDCYDIIVSTFTIRLQHLQEKRKRLTGIPPILREKLKFDCAHAEILLKELARQIPRFMKFMPWPEVSLHKKGQN